MDDDGKQSLWGRINSRSKHLGTFQSKQIALKWLKFYQDSDYDEVWITPINRWPYTL